MVVKSVDKDEMTKAAKGEYYFILESFLKSGEPFGEVLEFEGLAKQVGNALRTRAHKDFDGKVTVTVSGDRVFLERTDET